MIEMVIILALVGISTRERMRFRIRRQASFGDILNDSKASAFSEAIASTVATAGGIYLSLILLATFLQLELPSTVELMNIKFEPVAGAAVIITLIQPFLVRIWHVFKR